VDTFFAESENIDVSDFNRLYILQSKRKISSNFNLNKGFSDSKSSYNNNYLQDLTNKILKNIAGFVDWRKESIVTQTDKIDINQIFVSDCKLRGKNDFLIFFKDFLIKIILNIAFNLRAELDIKAETLQKFVSYYTCDSKGIELPKDAFAAEAESNLKSQAPVALDAESLKCIKHSAEFLIKIINMGLDKQKSEFDEEMKEILNAILDDIVNKSSINNNFFNNSNIKNNSTEINSLNFNNIIDNNIKSNNNPFNNHANNQANFPEKHFRSNSRESQQELFAPLTAYNKQLQSYAFNLVDIEKDDLFEVYISHLKNILVKNLIPTNSPFDSLEQYAFHCKTVNANLLKEIKMNILLVEEENIQAANIFDESESVVKNISSITNFINKLYVINKNLDCFYKNKEKKNIVNNEYKALIDDFFETFNFSNKKNNNYFYRSSVANDAGDKLFGNYEDENIFEQLQNNNVNLDFNSYFPISFNYTIYLLPGNSHDLFKNSHKNNDDSEKCFKPPNTNTNNNYLNQSLNNNNNNHNSNTTSNSADAKRQSQNLIANPVITDNSRLNNPHIHNTGFVSRYIAKKDYIYRMLVANLWSNLNYEISEEEYINAKRYQLLKENISFYISEAQNIFNLYLFKIELFRPPYQIFNLNRNLTNTGNDINESTEFLFWKNLKIKRKEEDQGNTNNKKKANGNEANLMTIE